MPVKLADKTLQFRSFVSLLMLTVLLLLGFCPLRNTLCKLVNPAPPKTTSKVPEYGKIIAGDDCAAGAELTATHPNEHLFGGTHLLFFAILLSSFFAAHIWMSRAKVPRAVTVGGCNVSLSIYLKNRVLRI